MPSANSDESVFENAKSNNLNVVVWYLYQKEKKI
jgi:hypothetical protein